jgi:hypothetical protein
MKATLPQRLLLRDLGAVVDHQGMESILDAIGNTPLVRVRRCAPPNGAELWLKLEYRNPTGSL